MLDPDSSPPSQAVQREPPYPNAPTPATPSLEELLRWRISRGGPLRFHDFMAAALYHPDLGYYAREPRQVGRQGDFFTSVSVGPTFGRLLATRFLTQWERSGRPDRWRIIECGGHDGTLAADILAHLKIHSPDALATIDYVICEPLPRLRAAQTHKLADFQPAARSIRDPASLADDPLPGIAFGNELLDALPFHIVEWRSEAWHEWLVAAADCNGFAWAIGPLVSDPALAEALAPLGKSFPEGYRTEVRTNFKEFLRPILAGLSSGLMIWPDYGFARPEYYHPDRTGGTLRTFSNHRAGDDPLLNPGARDITAHVDFTAMAEAAIALGCVPAGFRTQGPWLTEIARDWLLTLESNPDPAALRQFQTLTHPAHLGSRFHVLECSWNEPGAMPADPDHHRLALSACSPPR